MRLRDLDDELGAAFRAADHDGPAPEAKAALYSALGLSAASLGAAGAATAAGGSTAAIAKGTGTAVLVKWLVASAVVVSAAAATVHVASRPTVPSDSTPMVTAATSAAASPSRGASLGGARSRPLSAELTPAEPEPEEPSPAEPAPATAAAPPAVPVDALPTAALPTPVLPPPSAALRTADSAGPRIAGTAAPEPAKGTVREEIGQLDRARGLLARGRGADALQAISAYRRSFPGGVLAEEGEVLEVEALVSAGQRGRAQTLGQRFLYAHPASPLAPRVARAIDPGAR